MNTSSKKEFSIVIDGKTYFVKVKELAGGDLEVELDGSIHRVSLAEAAGQALPSLPREAEKAREPIPDVSRSPVRASIPVNGNGNVISAPMPGDIVQIHVKIGDQVSLGQEVCVLEAMKMKNILRASKAGIVKSVEVSLGQSVKFGDVLVRLES